jgi:hypothetical protein
VYDEPPESIPTIYKFYISTCNPDPSGNTVFLLSMSSMGFALLNVYTKLN